jgi:hypothetical protein
MKHTRHIAFAIFASTASLALADDATPDNAAPVTEATLDQQRGGFDTPELHIAMQLERAVFVNGEEVVRLTADIPDVAHMTVAQAETLANAAGGLLIQSGPANGFNAISLGPASTVIQNTLSDVQLAAMTTLNIQVNSLAAFREAAFQDSLRNGLGSITGVR